MLNYLPWPLPQRNRAEPLQNVFPTLLSIRLSKTDGRGGLQGMMKKVQGWSDWNPVGKPAVAVGKLSDELKSDSGNNI